MAIFRRVIIGLACIGLVTGVYAQEDDGVPLPAPSSYSRDMQLGIEFYNRGQDGEAMDRFMAVVTSGDPSEKGLANQYLNLITRRMNPAAVQLPEPGQTSLATTQISPNRVNADAEVLSTNSQTLMKNEIKSKLVRAQEACITALKEVKGVQVLARENGHPQAIAIASDSLFQKGVLFQQSARSILNPLTKLIYSLGSAQIVILPEGTAIGDSKVLDMRRAMAISGDLHAMGIAPVRIKVNLLNSATDIPQQLREFKGIIILFNEGQSLHLLANGPIADEDGPPLSLGVFPPAFQPEKSQAVIIEFSVVEPAAGLLSWKFELRQPAVLGVESTPLQQMVGLSPVFHQVFWNGRRNYFGPILSAGRYECVLTATDGKGRQRALHRWIELIGHNTPQNTSASPRAVVDQAPVAELIPTGDPVNPDELLAPNTAKPKSPRPKAHTKIKKRKMPTSTSAAQSKPVKPHNGYYELAFNVGTYQMTPEAESALEQAAKVIGYYPLDGLKVVGYAQPSEADAATLAEKRAQMVASLLINRYQVDAKRMQVTSGVSENGASKVRIYFVSVE